MAKISSPKNVSKKETILQKATQLFRQKGYNATSMRHLGEAVGVEAASLYNHIESKAELLKEICFGVAEDFTEQLNSVDNSTDSQAIKVEKIIRFHIGMMLERFEAVYVSNRDWKHLKEPHLTIFLQQRRNYEKRFATIIETGVAQNEFRKIHPHIAVLTILSAVRGIEFWQKNKRGLNAADMENDLVQILINGLAINL
jgi:TetR/AcrR family transcriptional regulator, cholesterol catabolism regulator